MLGQAMRCCAWGLFSVKRRVRDLPDHGTARALAWPSMGAPQVALNYFKTAELDLLGSGEVAYTVDL